MSTKVWQHPYVNIFKHVRVEDWKKCSREGDVTTYMDKTLKCSVYRIRGSIPASNYILLPKTSTQSLGLTGRYLYLLFRPSPGKHFVVHLDVATEDGQVIRISFSNLFKEFKSTATWLQFPFICGAAKGSVYESTAQTARQGLVGPAPPSVRWTCLMMDLHYVLSIYLNRRHSHLKSIKLCANMSVKNMFTSDLLCDPGLTFSEARQAGVEALQGASPMPREMSFPVPKGGSWHDLYDYIRFPSDGTKMPFDSIQKGHVLRAAVGAPVLPSPVRELARSVNVSKPVQDRVSLIQQITTPKPVSVPELGRVSSVPVGEELRESWAGGGRTTEQGAEGDSGTPLASDDGAVHVFAHRDSDITVPGHDSDTEETVCTKVTRPVSLQSKKVLERTQNLHPDPILKLNRIIGFGGCTTKCALWTKTGEAVVYPCHAVIVSMKIVSGQQRFFIGHTDKVSALAFNGNSTLLASAQTGSLSAVRVWGYQKGSCLAMFKTHAHSVSSLSFSHSGGVLCGVGKDSHGKTMVVVWNTQKVQRGGEVVVMAKAHTDVDIQAMKIAFFDDTRMVSCGRDNIRLWRVRSGALRSCPVNLGEYHCMEFTDIVFEEGHLADREPEDRTLFASSKSGHILEIDYKTVTIKNVRRLLPSQQKHSLHREKQTFSSGPGIAVNSISISSAFCATGSEDGYLRLWPLDFSTVFLEAGKKLQWPISSPLGVRVAMCLQLYDFISEDTPCAVSFHPTQQEFACGFRSGLLRVFNIGTSSLLAEHKQHRGEVIGLAFSPDGEYMYSAGSLGSLALYNSAEKDHHVLRVLGNVVSRGSTRCPDALAVSSDSRSLAFVGPSEHTVTVMDARSLDELMRIDVSVLDLDSTSLDSAVKVCFPPAPTGHLLVTTSANKILWLNAKTGRLLREVSNVHKHVCSSLSVSEDGRFLLTAGHKAVKVWDYRMKHDTSYQVFIGHSQPIQQVGFTPDQLGVVSVGDAIYYWDFLAYPEEMEEDKRLASTLKDVISRVTTVPFTTCNISFLSDSLPLLPLTHLSNQVRLCFQNNDHIIKKIRYLNNILLGDSVQKSLHAKKRIHFYTVPAAELMKPQCFEIAKCESGFHGDCLFQCLSSCSPGLFAYSCGCVVVVEDLHSGSQRHLLGHSEEISTLAVTHDAQVIASASGGSDGSRSLICIWNVPDGSRRNTISYHRGHVQAMAYSRDDFFFLSAGQFRSLSQAQRIFQTFLQAPPRTHLKLRKVGLLLIIKVTPLNSISEICVSKRRPLVIRRQTKDPHNQCGNVPPPSHRSSGKDGLMAVSSPRTGMTIRIISDHKGALISTIQCVKKQVRKCRLMSLHLGPESVSAMLSEILHSKAIQVIILTLGIILKLLYESKTTLIKSLCKYFSLCILYSLSNPFHKLRVLDHVLINYVVISVVSLYVFFHLKLMPFQAFWTQFPLILLTESFVQHVSKSPFTANLLCSVWSLLYKIESVLTLYTLYQRQRHCVFEWRDGLHLAVLRNNRLVLNEFGLEGNELWLAASADRRVSIWASDWLKDKCELLDWLTFPAPARTEELDSLPPSLAAFCPSAPGVVLYAGYGVEKEIVFYSLLQKQIIKRIALSHWATCLSLSPKGHLIAVGSDERLLKLIKSTSGKFQDFVAHSDAVHMCRFAPSGNRLFTSAYNEILLWDVLGL
uniref:WD repeat domain 90 n=1 Tax=Lepisosteus oculatus TaxID=7918 RepID=W5M6P3_LEPOC